ncbi:hypothetical protein JG687_00015983 [Phytophthora cactorum]|uniref:Uncharacterized protein n=1 Tax=Phytophthora cactorum TaxID=29920 RepID=A0A8T1TSA1_9STRA|nr:hypothetical protein JG687_00015983 [Phytophthora cactorum]
MHHFLHDGQIRETCDFSTSRKYCATSGREDVCSGKTGKKIMHEVGREAGNDVTFLQDQLDITTVIAFQTIQQNKKTKL